MFGIILSLIFPLIDRPYTCNNVKNLDKKFVLASVDPVDGESYVTERADDLINLSNSDPEELISSNSAFTLFFDQGDNTRLFEYYGFHNNGKIKEMYSGVNGRVRGLYRLWHPNGLLKIQCNVLNGKPFLGPLIFNEQGVVDLWEIDGDCSIWNSCGHLEKVMHFENGKMIGEQKEFFQDGTLKSIKKFVNNKQDGETKYFSNEITVFDKVFKKNEVVGVENFSEDRLLSGKYFENSRIYSFVKNGRGSKTIISDLKISENPKTPVFVTSNILDGQENGLVKLFILRNGKIILLNTYNIFANKKHGEEVIYFNNENNSKHTLITWSHGILSGKQCEWYENGMQKTYCEVVNNQLCGEYKMWSLSGRLIINEVYQGKQKLISGYYYSPLDGSLLSHIENGHGIATIIDHNGNIYKKIKYENGYPSVFVE